MRFKLTILMVVACSMLHAQDVNRTIAEANDAYKKGDYKNAVDLYKKALEKDGKNNIAKFNLGNALIKQEDVISAEKYYDEVTSAESDISLRSKAFYNKGVAEVRQQKLLDAVDAFKHALLLSPEDDDARENLQKALDELKRHQQQNAPQQKKSKPKQQQKKQPSNPEMMEQKFSELRDKEKQLQKLLQQKPATNQPDKDW